MPRQMPSAGRPAPNASRTASRPAARRCAAAWNAPTPGRISASVSSTARAASGLGVAYYANSFVCRPEDDAPVTAWSEHEGDRFPAAVRRGNVVGVQFHPEKSSAPGLAFVKAFVESVRDSGLDPAC